MNPVIKICGVTGPQAIASSADAGATHVGFNFYPGSPRFLGFADAQGLARRTPPELQRVVLLKDGDERLADAAIAAVRPHMLQIYGAPSGAALAGWRDRYGCAVIAPLAIREPADIDRADEWASFADVVLFEGKPMGEGALPGGEGQSFDWSWLAGREWPRPWWIAGGLTPANVAEAIRRSGTKGVDVSSGVEDGPGEKSPEKITAFVRQARAAFEAS